jgi:hypothetical protein
VIVDDAANINLTVQRFIALRFVYLVHECLSHAWKYIWKYFFNQEQTVASIRTLSPLLALLLSPS